MPFFRQTIFLQAALRLVGERHLDESRGNQRLYVPSIRTRIAPYPEAVKQLPARQFRAAHRTQQCALCIAQPDIVLDIVLIMVLDLVLFLLDDAAQHSRERELDERSAVVIMPRRFNRPVVCRSIAIEQRLYRNPCKERIPTREEQRLPEPSHAPVAVDKWVNGLDLIMEDRALKHRMQRGGTRSFE